MTTKTIREQITDSRVVIEDYLVLEAMVKRYTLDGVREALEVIKNVHTKWPELKDRKLPQTNKTQTAAVVTRPRLKIKGSQQRAVLSTDKEIQFD